MILVGLNQQADEDRRYIDTHLSFDKDIYVKNFEITIRLLGALQSSYELTGDPLLLALADDLGTRLLARLQLAHRHAVCQRQPEKPARFAAKTLILRKSARFLLEFGTLSKLTHKPIYYEQGQARHVELYNRRSAIGLFGDEINVRTGQWTGNTANINRRLRLLLRIHAQSLEALRR